MSTIFYDWPAYHMLITVMRGRDSYSFLTNKATQDEVVEELDRRWPNAHFGITGVVPVSEEVFEMLERRYRDSGYLIEGEE